MKLGFALKIYFIRHLTLYTYISAGYSREIIAYFSAEFGCFNISACLQGKILDDTAAGINAKAYDTNFSKNIRITFSGLPKLLKSAVVALIDNLSFVC